MASKYIVKKRYWVNTTEHPGDKYENNEYPAEPEPEGLEQ